MVFSDAQVSYLQMPTIQILQDSQTKKIRTAGKRYEPIFNANFSDHVRAFHLFTATWLSLLPNIVGEMNSIFFNTALISPAAANVCVNSLNSS
jgi:hypothetical protein